MNLGKQRRIQIFFEGLYRTGFKPWTKHGREPTIDKFLAMLKKEKPGAHMLDLGCGDGWISLYAVSAGFEVWGIDASATAIEQAKKAAVEAKLTEKTNFQVGDALDLPYDEDFFDAMIDRGLLHHILPENREIYMKQVTRVLKPNALVHLSVFSTRNPRSIGQLFTKELVTELFSEFEIVHFEEDPYPSTAPAHLLHFILSKN